MNLLALLLARRNARLRAEHERIRAEVRASFSAAGGRAAQAKRRSPFREKARAMMQELGLAELEALR